MSVDNKTEDLFFDAILHPHRSLSPRGFLLLMSAVGVVSFVAGTIFVLNDAWPVFGFFGLDAALLYFAFRKNYRDGRLYEHIQLSQEVLAVERVWPQGKTQSWSLNPYWVQVQMDDPPKHESRLKLLSHGKELVLGTFLSPKERLEVAHALSDALQAQKTSFN